MKQTIKNMILSVLLCGVGLVGIAGAQTDSSVTYFSLFTDQKSVDIGALVTVYIVEVSSGSNQAATSMKKKDGLGIDASGSGMLAGSFPGIGGKVNKNSEFDGQGTTSQKANLRAKMTARIIERLPNDNLKIEGRREVNVNGDKQTIILSGVVRAQDVTANNIVYSYNIADAKISYKGKGAINQGQRPGWIFRIINWFF